MAKLQTGKSRLTISMDTETIDQAKRLAAERGTTVSAMVTHFIRAIAQTPGIDPESDLGPVTRRALGLVQDSDDRKVADLMAEALAEKYGLDL